MRTHPRKPLQSTFWPYYYISDRLAYKFINNKTANASGATYSSDRFMFHLTPIQEPLVVNISQMLKQSYITPNSH